MGGRKLHGIKVDVGQKECHRKRSKGGVQIFTGMFWMPEYQGMGGR